MKYSDKDWAPVSNVSKDSTNSERITLLNTRKNELISLKRKTLVLMNKLIEKNQNNDESGNEFEKWKRKSNKAESPSVRFTDFSMSSKMKNVQNSDNLNLYIKNE